MAFGLNMAQVIGRLGDDVTIHNLTSGGEERESRLIGRGSPSTPP